MRSKLAFLMVLLSLCGWSQAQVYRCEDGKGKISYTDAPCAQAHRADLIERKRSRAEIEQERLKATLALELRMQEENEAQLRRELAKQQETKEQQLAAAAPAPDLSNSPACQQARKDLDWIHNIQSLSDAARRARMNAAITQVNAACGTKTELIQEPVQVVAPIQCYNGRCFNAQGGVIPGRTH